MIRRGYVDTAYGQVHYRMAGTRSPARPVVLLHQTASSSAMFEGLMERLAPEYWIFAPDTPGFGGTEPPRERASIEHYARVLGDACRRMEIASAWLFGHHTGASIAVEMARGRDGLAHKLVLSGPPYLTTAQKRTLRAKTEPVVIDAEGDYLNKLWRRLRAKDLEAPLALTHRELVSNLAAGERYHEAYDAVFEYELETRLAEITCPTLVMAGDKDTLYGSLVPAYGALQRGAIRRIPDATTYVVDRAPGAVAAILREFFVEETADARA